MPLILQIRTSSWTILWNLLRWLREYLCNRSSSVLFKGAISTIRKFDLGTPQGDVLSQFLFNILMHCLLSLLPYIPGITITCYADDICRHSTSPEDLQRFLHSFYKYSSSCGPVISQEKCRIFSPVIQEHFLISRWVPMLYHSVHSISTSVHIAPSTPVGLHVHPLVQGLSTRL